MKKLTDESFCPVNGKHKNTRMKHVPDDYLRWLKEQPWLQHKYPEVFEYIKENWWAIKE